MSHTRTPWHEGFITNSGRNICAPKSGMVIANAKSDDDSQRMIACVNACEGLTNEQLNSGILQEFISKLKGK